MFISYLNDIFVFVLGVCIGSFLNCFIYRMEEGKKISGRSFCPHCKHMLAWQDLFPVFSWVFLSGKCRYCKAKISVQYPVVEIATGLFFITIFNFKFEIFNQFLISNIINLIFLFYIASVLAVIFVYDLKHYIIPDKVLLPAIIIALAYRLFSNLINSNWILNSNFILQISNYLLAVLVGAGFFLAIFLFSRGKWMGFGDVKLAILMGLVLGFNNILVALFLAFFFGAIIGVILMVVQKKSLKSEIPFGPFLILGTFMAMLWGSEIIQWYFRLFQ